MAILRAAGRVALIGRFLLPSIAVLLVFACSEQGDGDAPNAAGPTEAMREALVDRIAAESAGLAAPPRSSGAGDFAATPADGTAAAAPTPPAGFSFVSEPAQMAVSRLPEQVGADPIISKVLPDWLEGPDNVATLADQAAAAGRDWTFGWVGLAEDANRDELESSLNALGAEVVGASGRLLRARLPGDPSRLTEIAFLPELAGLGAAPVTVKLPGELVMQAEALLPGEQLPVFISLMDGDADGRWRRALEERGAVVARFDADIRVYTATVDAAALEAIAAADFVQAVEAVALVQASHDTAVPAMGADALRMYSGSPGLFSGIGGASVPVAVMDTGLNINHMDISSHRRSICGANFVWVEPQHADTDLWLDEGGHGTHVTGTIAGNGFVAPEFAGMAPAVSHIRFAKVLSRWGYGFTDSIQQGMDYLSQPSGCVEAPGAANQVKPLIVNMSLAASSNVFEGRGVGERKLDSVVWTHNQLYVVAQANSGSRAFSNYGTAKNSLAVGAVLDSGEPASFSSYGPTADGRLAPQVVGTGVDVFSASGAGVRGGYVNFSGTSMAAPAVAGVATLLMDAAPEHREQPALTRARLMASAVWPDVWLDDPGRFPATNSGGPGTLHNRYGMGLVSARTTVLERDRPDGWVNGSAVSRIEEGDLATQNIEVPAGASRLVLVMTWDEPPTDTISDAVLNDLDLYLDLDGDCGAGACGEYESVSRIDNVEWIVVRNPPAGTHRAKIASKRVFTAPPRAALAWTVIRGASAPSLRIEADAGSLDETGEVALTVTADSYVAAGTRLQVNCRTAVGPCNSWQWSVDGIAVGREDGIERVVDDSGPSWRKPLISLGEIAAGESQTLKLNLGNQGGESVRIYFTATGWNARPASTSVLLRHPATPTMEVPVMASPANADFDAAAELTESPQQLDLLLAGTEPGEPPSALGGDSSRRPTNSVWYDWTAPADGLYLFRADAKADEGEIKIEFFQGDSVGGLERALAGNVQTVEFFSYAGDTFKIRISQDEDRAPTPPGELYWSQSSQLNDLFSQSIELEGATGSVEGNNQGATLESGESFGELAATVWYRWTAPDDGDWKFISSNEALRLLVFSGDQLEELRLVSGIGEASASFPAERGREYRILVAARDAFRRGGDFELQWYSADRDEKENDDYSDAEDLGDAKSSSWDVETSTQATVEPGEPAATGVRTQWLQWTAPEDGRYTWRLFDPGLDSPASLGLTLTVFSGDSLRNLVPLAATEPNRTASNLVFEAVKGEVYSFSLGYQRNSFSAFYTFSVPSMLHWGPTPANDDPAGATRLTGGGGELGGSNEFATIEPTERGSQGTSSVWYDYQAPASGWVRFSVAGDVVDEDESGPRFSLAVYRRSGGELRLISHGAAAVGEIVFEAEAGANYLIRLGTHGVGLGGGFTLRWEASATPPWLEFLGVMSDGDEDGNGHILELDIPWRSSVVFNEDGTALFLNTRSDLTVFERDPASGALSFAQQPETAVGDTFLMTWDRRRNRLLFTDRCGEGNWWQLEVAADNLRRPGVVSPVTVSGEPEFDCVATDLLMDSTGSFVHVVYELDGIETYAVTPGGLEHIQTLRLDRLLEALVNDSVNELYALTDKSLHVYSRDPQTGMLEAIREVESFYAANLALSDDGRFLFAVGTELGTRASVYELKPDAEPLLLASLEDVPAYMRSGWLLCEFAAPRAGVSAVDVFCNDFIATLQWRSETGRLLLADHLIGGDFDRFGNLVRDPGYIAGGGASPDGKHAYLSVDPDSLVLIKRVNNPATPVSTTPTLSAQTGDLSVPMLEFRPEDETLCFSAELQAVAGAGDWLESGAWALTHAAETRCGPGGEDIPTVDAETATLRIPYGMIHGAEEAACFTLELRASGDFLSWTSLGGASMDCR